MQEEIEHKTVNFAISTTKLSARTLLRGMQFLLRQYDKHASQGKQSMKRLVRQNRGVTNVEIQKTGIKDFDRFAKRYHIDYSIQKDLSCTPPRYIPAVKSVPLSSPKASPASTSQARSFTAIFGTKQETNGWLTPKPPRWSSASLP